MALRRAVACLMALTCVSSLLSTRLPAGQFAARAPRAAPGFASRSRRACAPWVRMAATMEPEVLAAEPPGRGGEGGEGGGAGASRGLRSSSLRRLPGGGTAPTVWSEFGDLARRVDASGRFAGGVANLGQGFPDWAPPAFVKKAWF